MDEKVLNVPICINGGNIAIEQFPDSVPSTIELEERELFINQDTNTLLVGTGSTVAPVSVARFSSFENDKDSSTVNVKEMSTSAFFVGYKEVDGVKPTSPTIYLRSGATLTGLDNATRPTLSNLQLDSVGVNNAVIASTTINCADCKFIGDLTFGTKETPSTATLTGPLILPKGTMYGESFPESPKEGQLFFLQVKSS